MAAEIKPRSPTWNAKGQKLVDDLVARLGHRIGSEDQRRAFANATLLGLGSVLPVAHGREFRGAEAQRLLNAAREALNATQRLERLIRGSLLGMQLHTKSEREIGRTDWPEPAFAAGLNLHTAYLTELASLAEAEIEAAPPVRRGRKTGQALVLVEWTALNYRLHFGKWPGRTTRDDAKTPFLRVCDWLTRVPNSSGWRGRISIEVVASGIAAAKRRIVHAERWNTTHTPDDPQAHLNRAIQRAMDAIATDNAPWGKRSSSVT